MSWALGFDDKNDRDIGYGVPAFCDHPECSAEIDRGLAYRCGGCRLYFCSRHQMGSHQRCQRCVLGQVPFDPKPDHPQWVEHKERHPSWAKWREGRRQLRKAREPLTDIPWSPYPDPPPGNPCA